MRDMVISLADLGYDVPRCPCEGLAAAIDTGAQPHWAWHLVPVWHVAGHPPQWFPPRQQRTLVPKPYGPAF